MSVPAADVVTIVWIAGAWAGGVGALGWLATRRLRMRSVRAAMLSLAVLTLVITLAAVLGTAREMFLSAHDLQVTMIVVGVVFVLVIAGAVLVSRMLERDQRHLSVAVRTLGEGRAIGEPATDGAPAPRLSAELGAVHAELVAAGRRLEQARERERALARAWQDTLAAVSHDLRTPLAGLRAMAEALEDGVAPDPADYHARMRATVDRLGRMVDGLLDLTLARTETSPTQQGPVALSDVVSDCLAGLRPLAQAGGVRLTGTADAPLEVTGDAAALARALDNLVANALAVTPSGGAVNVRLSRVDRPASGQAQAALPAGRAAQISVTDSGPGIADADLDRIFDAGVRGPHSTGAGLGLATARALVESHGGTLRAEHTESGARLVITLPLPRGAHLAEPSSAKPALSSAAKPALSSAAKPERPSASGIRGSQPSSATSLADDAVM